MNNVKTDVQRILRMNGVSNHIQLQCMLEKLVKIEENYGIKINVKEPK